MYQKLDVVLLQEHNIKEIRTLEYITKYFDIVLNTSPLLKGGTCILIRKNKNIEIVNQEMDAEGEIIGIQIKYCDNLIPIINVYAPSGTNEHKEREDFFRDKILYYLRHNHENLIIGGDFNSVVSMKDCTNENYKSLLSKGLKELTNKLKLKDIMKDKIGAVEYTYIRNNYGSRIDKIFVKSLHQNISKCQTIPLSFSDHTMVNCTIKITDLERGRGMWKLNTNILKYEEVQDNFNKLWHILINKKK